MVSVAVESVIVGTNTSNLPTFNTIELNLISERITVKDLIYRTVKQQIKHYLNIKKEEAQTVQKMFNRQYLSNSEIEKQAKEGTIQIPSDTKQNPPAININRECQRAVQCFNGNVYKLLIDGETMEELEYEITLTPKSKIVFIRLMPLVGG